MTALTTAPPHKPRLWAKPKPGSRDPLLSAKRVAEELFGVSRRTLARWVASKELGFPPPVLIRDRWYFYESELEAFRAARARHSIAKGT
jgi:predicted DNA-binding transcriptional regulator AlpA